MSSSTVTSPRNPTVLKESPSRYHNRYNERFKSLTSTPPREAVNPFKTTIKSSPLTEEKPVETIPAERKPVQVNEEPVPNKIPSPPTPPEIPAPPKRQNMPAYMQATRSFSNKQQTKKDSRQANNPLGPRSKGGITKRVGTAKIPRYQSTTTINAIEDIKNEMTPEDVYIPLAARIKLFEKGLGNGSNPSPPIISKSSPAASPKPTPRRTTPSESSSRPSSSASTYSRPRLTDASRVPHYAQQTAQSISRQREKTSIPKEPKRFHFATNDRASFKEKLDLWRHKDKQATIENQKRLHANRKRKREDHETNTSSKNSKH